MDRSMARDYFSWLSTKWGGRAAVFLVFAGLLLLDLFLMREDGIRDPFVDLAQRPRVLSSRVAGFTSATRSEQGITQWGEESPP